MRRLLHALFTCVLLVAGMGLRPAPARHACCGMATPPAGPAGGGCPCPQPPAAPALSPAPLVPPVVLESPRLAATEREDAPVRLLPTLAPVLAPRAASNPGPDLHRRLALLRCWRT